MIWFINKDEDGVLSFAELNVVMKSLGQRPSGKYEDDISRPKNFKEIGWTHLAKDLQVNMIMTSL